MYTPEQILQKIWLSKKEGEIYLACLEYGGLTVTALQRQTQLPRTTIYDTLQKLELRGYISKSKRKQTLTFYAVDIQELMVLMEDKIKLYERRKNLLNENIPEFQQLMKWTHIIPEVKMYQGTDALSIIFGQVKSTTVVKTIYSAQAAAEFLDDTLITEVHGAHEYNNTPKQILLINDEIVDKEKEKLLNQWFEVKVLPKWYSMYTDFIIIDSKLFLLAYGKNIQALEIDHPIFVHSFREIFRLLREQNA